MERTNNPANVLGFEKLTTAVRPTGLSEHVFAMACARREIPVDIHTFGSRGTRYVRADQFAEWLKSLNRLK